jgi:hypothetical protein
MKGILRWNIIIFKVNIHCVCRKKMRNKKKWGIMAIAACLYLGPLTAFAETVPFNVTLNSRGGGDVISRRAKKADGDKYFYVTPTKYTPYNGGFFATSYQLRGSAKSDMKYVQADLNRARWGYYKNGFCPSGEYYYMYTEKGYIPNGYSSLNVLGRYTP